MQRLITFLLAVCLVLVSPNAIAQSAWPAGKVLFTDADDLQEKFDAGDLGGGGGALDNITTVTCSANQAVIGSTTGVYRITTGCVADDTILIPNLSTFLATTIILQSIINDTGVNLVVDASANTVGVVNESGSAIGVSGSTFSVVQIAASHVHLIGTGPGAAMREVAGVTSATGGVNALLLGSEDSNSAIDPAATNSIIATSCATNRLCLIGSDYDQGTGEGPVPNATAFHAGGGLRGWPDLPIYDSGVTYKTASYSGILPGAYDDIIQTQTSVVGGSHNLIGPQDVGTGHSAVLGNGNLIAGEADYASIVGSSNWIWLKEASTGAPAAGISILGIENLIDQRTTEPPKSGELSVVGHGNTIVGSLQGSSMLGAMDCTFTAAQDAAAIENVHAIGARDCRIAAPAYTGQSGTVPSNVYATGRYADAWIHGQRVRGTPGYEIDTGGTSLTNTVGSLQTWEVVLRKEIRGTSEQNLETDQGADTTNIFFNHASLWNWQLDATCYDMGVDLDEGASDPAFGVWRKKGFIIARDWDNSSTNRALTMFVDGTEAAPVTASTGNPTTVSPLISYSPGTPDPANWTFRIGFTAASAEFEVSVESTAGDDLRCNALLRVIEMRNS